MNNQKIVTYLWFNNKAEEAVNFYLSVFKSGKVLSTTRNGKSGPGPEGSVMVMNFELEGQEFIALNGGPQFQFTPAISLLVNCGSQDEIDALWSKLTADGGQENQCGWLQDKFGLSWQIVPANIGKLMSNPDKEKAQRTVKALMGMKKLNIKELEEA